MQILVSSGTGDSPEIAYLNALGGVVGPMNEAEQSLIISHTVEHTPNGVVVSLRVAVYDEEDIKKLNEPAQEEGEGDNTGAVSRARAEHSNIADLAYLQSAQMLQKDQEMIRDQVQEGLVHVGAPHPTENFEHASHPAPDNDNGSHEHNKATDLAPAPILTKLSEQEIDNSVSHEMLSEDMVTPPPAPAMPAVDYEEIVTPEGQLVKVPKKAPPADSLDYVA